MTALSQGLMLGLYIMGLEVTPFTLAFAVLTGLCLTAGFAFIGATWLIGKTEAALQRRAVAWAKAALVGVLAGIVAVSLATPLVSPRIFERWFEMPQMLWLAPLPIGSALLVWVIWRSLGRLPATRDRGAWTPFWAATALFTLAFLGLAWSFYPYVIPERMTIYQAASAPESLTIILIGTAIVLPVIIGYSIIAYTVFRGKATALSYD
jgi:cytochrome bd ubiquinol oxidase subunit II